ncbi:hypothetical protein P692DRAFT_201122158 [Suillus brevipes Sb2]|nr:hypothetical protein P692DRAFT_201122158 [Suillus brevipes Sb2]
MTFRQLGVAVHRISDLRLRSSGLGERVPSDGHCIGIPIPFSAFRILGMGMSFWVAASGRDQGIIKAK